MIMYCSEEVKKLILKLVYLVSTIKFTSEVGFELYVALWSVIFLIKKIAILQVCVGINVAIIRDMSHT